MGRVAALFAGQNRPEARAIRPQITTGTVTLDPLVILKPDREDEK